jgi:hypothetical protein
MKLEADVPWESFRLSLPKLNAILTNLGARKPELELTIEVASTILNYWFFLTKKELTLRQR